MALASAQERGLPDSRLALDDDQLRPRVAGGDQRLGDERQLGLPADEQCAASFDAPRVTDTR